MYSVIKNFDRYIINTSGVIKNRKTNKIIKQYLTPRGYYIVNIYDNNGKNITQNVHKLVANTFLEKSQSHLVVNHINHIKTDNRLENLEWITQKENVNNAIKIGKWTNNMKPVIEIDHTGKKINWFRSVTQCAKFHNTDSSLISRVCNGKMKSYKGKIFLYDLKNNT